MIQSATSQHPVSVHSIAPAQVIRGSGAWIEAQKPISNLFRNPLLLGRSESTQAIRSKLSRELNQSGLRVFEENLEHDCCEPDLQRLQKDFVRQSCDGVIAAGGGKVLDSGKLLADRLDVPCVTVPLSAATCAGWTALSNLYSPDGAFEGDQGLKRCPDLLIFDHDLLLKAPKRTLASGIADALAKWYEASVSSGSSQDGVIQQAVQMARVLRDQLLIDSITAMKEPGSEAWKRVVDACGLTAGVIGGLGGARCRTVAAHAVHNGLTQLQACHAVLHGEKVGFGILVQLRLEERLGGNRLAAQAHRQLLPLLRELGLPVCLDDLGLGHSSIHQLQQVCQFACREGSDLHHLPFEVSPGALIEALVGAAETSPVLP
jgi:glycerol dehydrogenase